ncbi:MAG: DUF748 domain-containing protein [Colwelliaceae bacterium]|nr:DUF748 domain-containing protein [Colwelliaceae bacterium]
MKKISILTFKILAAFFIFLYLLIWLISPYVSSHFIKKNIIPYDLTLNDNSHLRYNPFISQVIIEDFSLEKASKTVFTINELTIELSLTKLLFKELYIKSFEAEGITGQVKISDGKMIIAGVEIPQSPPQEVPAQEEKIKNENDYQIVMPSLLIKDSLIDLTLNKENLSVEINRLSIEDLAANKLSQSAMLSAEVALKESIFQFSAEADLINAQGEVHSNIQVKHFDLTLVEPWLPNNLSNLQGLFTLNSKQKTTLNGDNTNIQLDDTNLSLAKLSVVNDNINLSVAENLVEFPKIIVSLETDKPLEISGDGNIQLTDIKATNAQNPHLILASSQKLNVDGISITTPQALPTITLDSINIHQMTLSHDIESEIPALTQFSQLTISNVVASEQSVDIDIITLSDLIVDAQVNSEKVMTSLVPISSMNKEKPAETPVDDEAKIENITSSKFHISLNDFHLTNDAKIIFKDQSVQPVFLQELTVEKLQLKQINSREPETEGLIVIQGKNNKYAHFNFDGLLKPFLEEPYYALKGDFKEVSLPAVSSYVKESLNHEIKSGQLDFAIDTQLNGNNISGDANILLRGIDFTAANDHEADSLKDQTAIPFSVALGMLKDSQGNVDLSLPLSGNTSDPSFGLTGFATLLVKQATMMAAKDYLMTTFVPYANVVSIAMSAGEMLLKVRFNDLAFSPKQVELSESQQIFLKEFSSLMQDKPDTQITLCPISTPADAGLLLGKKIIDKDIINELNKLSLQRVDNFKQHVIDKYQIASSRLLVCTPQIDSAKNAQPRITFSS